MEFLEPLDGHAPCDPDSGHREATTRLQWVLSPRQPEFPPWCTRVRLSFLAHSVQSQVEGAGRKSTSGLKQVDGPH